MLSEHVGQLISCRSQPYEVRPIIIPIFKVRTFRDRKVSDDQVTQGHKDAWQSGRD